jgi:hypothetical protein
MNYKSLNKKREMSDLLYVRRNAPAIQNIEQIKRLRRSRHGLKLHLDRHVSVLNHSLSFQHLACLFFVLKKFIEDYKYIED